LYTSLRTPEKVLRRTAQNEAHSAELGNNLGACKQSHFKLRLQAPKFFPSYANGQSRVLYGDRAAPSTYNSFGLECTVG